MALLDRSASGAFESHEDRIPYPFHQTIHARKTKGHHSEIIPGLSHARERQGMDPKRREQQQARLCAQRRANHGAPGRVRLVCLLVFPVGMRIYYPGESLSVRTETRRSPGEEGHRFHGGQASSSVVSTGIIRVSGLHISRNLFSFLCRLEPFWGIGRLLVVLVAVRTAGSQWRFEIR